MRYIRSLAPAPALALVVLAVLAPVVGRAQSRSQAGWVGLVITTGIGQTNSAGAMVFSDYPVVESIDPGSPAERAGLQPGDVIISINSQDLRKNPIPMQSLLVPGQNIVFRFKRDDETRSLRVTVAERPVGTSGHMRISIIGPAPDPTTGARTRREVELSARAGSIMPAISLAPIVRGPGSPSMVIAGAELTRLNDGLREALNFRGQGVFVVNVVLGSPAGDAGLKSGDVILRANREALTGPAELVRLMHLATASMLRLDVVRNRRQQTLTLRW